MLTFYEHPLSPYARKVKILLYEKGIPFDCRFVNPYAGPRIRTGPRSLRASPRREVPVLVDEDASGCSTRRSSRTTSKSVGPNHRPCPSQPAERACVRMLEELCDTELEAVNWGHDGDPVLQARDRRAGREAAGGGARPALDASSRGSSPELDGRDWMNGASFGRGDAAVYPHVTGSAGTASAHGSVPATARLARARGDEAERRARNLRARRVHEGDDGGRARSE